MSRVADFSESREHNISCKKELIAGITTSMTIVYVLVIQSGATIGYGDAVFITGANGVMATKEVIVVTCVIISGLITLLMALYVDFPFTLATGMGGNFMFGALIQSQQLSFDGAMAMILISGVIFLLLIVSGIHDLIVKVIPENIKISIGTVIGFFIAYLGFKNTGIAAFMESGIGMGNSTDPVVILTVLESVIAATLTACKVNGATLIGIVIATLPGIPVGITTVSPTSTKVLDFTGLGSVTFSLDFESVFSFSSVILIFTAFCGDFSSTLGTTLGASAKAGMLNENGDLLNTQQPFLVNIVDICVGAPTGNTVVTTFVESNVGVEAGGRTGFTSVVISIILMIIVFLSPLVLMIPSAVTGPTLIFVGLLMTNGFKDIDFAGFVESFGPFVMIIFIVLTGSIAGGTSVDILASALIRTAAGKFREVYPIMHVMMIPLICYFIYG